MLKNKHYIFIITLLLYYLPYFIQGESSKILYFDNVDSNIIWQKLAIKHFELFFSPNETIPELLNGVPFSSIYSNFDIATIFFYVFGIFWGYVINKILMSLIAYFGMFFLLKSHFKIKNITILLLASIAFGLHPFWSFSMHVAGLPFVFYGFLNIYENKTHFIDYFLIVLFCLSSNLILIGVFVLVIFTYLFVSKWIKEKQIKWPDFFALALMSSTYLLSHYPIIYSFIKKDFITHRVEMTHRSLETIPLVKYLGAVILCGDDVDQIEGSGGYFYVILLLPIIIFLLKRQKGSLIVIKMLAFIVLGYLLVFFINWEITESYYHLIFELIPVAWDRFLWIHPIVWLIIIAVVLQSFYSNEKKIFYKIGLASCFIHILAILYFHPFITSKSSVFFSNVYSIDLFEEIKKDLSDYDIKVLCVGFDPAIANFNDIQTVGGFSVSYPLSYKHKFHKIIVDELEKPPKINFYNSFFMNWGSKCYAFSREITGEYDKTNTQVLKDLRLNYQEAEKLGAKYVLSSYPIDNPSEISLKKKYENVNSNRDIYVYEIL